MASANLIKNHLYNAETKVYLAENGISSVQFEQYYKGNSALGFLVEVCVKFTKRLIYGTIRNNVLSYEDFTFTVVKAMNVINKKSVAYLAELRDDSNDDVAAPVTPEFLLFGRETLASYVIPTRSDSVSDPNWVLPSDSVTLWNKFR